MRFLAGHRDGWLEPTFDLQREIVRVIRQVRPQRILTQSPERNYERIQGSHPDHLAAGEATIRAAYPAAENPFAWPDLDLGFWHVGELWLMAHPTPTHPVDITDRFDRKVAALRAHASQTGHRDSLEEMLRQWGSRMASSLGLPDGRLAEAFAIVPHLPTSVTCVSVCVAAPLGVMVTASFVGSDSAEDGYFSSQPSLSVMPFAMLLRTPE